MSNAPISAPISAAGVTPGQTAMADRGFYPIECRGLSRFFGPFAALRRVSLQLPAGHLVMLLGPNGAGKSTLLRVLAGALRPSSGEARICGAAWGTPEARRATGFLAHESLLHPTLTVAENLAYYATLYGLPGEAAGASLRRVGGEKLARLRVPALSQGMRQKAALARCLLHAPR
ncbi:MAG: ATP-binding cassette domain-containing protein, partial [Terriglobales bacterium]